MTIQELIEKLNAVENKQLKVRVEGDMGAYEVNAARVVTDIIHFKGPTETYFSLTNG